ncbi:MAG: tryptophan synthase subunit alpha [Candidatus Eremiobacteraeota bacterium]|nr:tryptophan synthase subunit alpha [Candidatus Eremiobacteraeota bacterium]
MGFRRYLLEKRETPGAGKAFIPYFTLGDPDEKTSLALISAALEGGAEGLELGFPFSDPIADGPVLQRSAARSLAAGMTPGKCLALIERVRKLSPVPLGLLLYYNLIHAYGIKAFCRNAAACGVNAVLAADLPPESAAPLMEGLAANDLESVFMVGLTTPRERIRDIAGLTTGYIYLVAVLGVTGERSSVSARTIGKINEVREVTDTPVSVGFGISKPDHAALFRGTGADAVIVGSALATIIEEHRGDRKKLCSTVRDFVRSIREALDREG